MARHSLGPVGLRTASPRWLVPAASLAVSGVAAFAACLLTSGSTISLPVLSLLFTRPQLALSVLIGPTGLTFPCWAATRSAPLRGARRPRNPLAAPA